MKFFPVTQISSPPFQYWAFPDDAQDIPEPSHQLSALCSMHHNQQPRNDAPSISVSDEEIRFEACVKSYLLTSLQNCLCSTMVDIQRGHGHGPCSQSPSKFERFHYCKSELLNHGLFAEYHPEEHDNDISLPKQGVLTFYLHYGLSYDNQPLCKSMKFI